MNLDSNHFKSLSRDLVIEIMSRLDGCTVAAMASTCVCLWDASRDDRLWHKICRDKWPSMMNTLLLHNQVVMSSKRFYADASPLVLYEVTRDVLKNIPAPDAISSPWDYMSLVDVSFKGDTIYSKAVDGIMESMFSTCKDKFKRFLCYPFKVDLLGVHCPKGLGNGLHDFDTSADESKLPWDDAFKGYEEGKDASDGLLRDLQLSWILFDKRQGKAVNISSQKARSIYRSNPSTNEYVISFGCIIPVDNIILTHQVAECVITAKCRLMIEKRRIRWKEITLVIKDIDGSHLNGERSMAVMKQACVSARSVNNYNVEMGYETFYRQKSELKSRNEQDESSANILCAVAAIAALLGICYACATLL